MGVSNLSLGSSFKILFFMRGVKTIDFGEELYLGYPGSLLTGHAEVGTWFSNKDRASFAELA